MFDVMKRCQRLHTGLLHQSKYIASCCHREQFNQRRPTSSSSKGILAATSTLSLGIMRDDAEEANYKDEESNTSGGGSGAEERENQGIDDIAAGLREKVAMSVTNSNDFTTDAANDDKHFIEAARVDVGNTDNDVGETPYIPI